MFFSLEISPAEDQKMSKWFQIGCAFLCTNFHGIIAANILYVKIS